MNKTDATFTVLNTLHSTESAIFVGAHGSFLYGLDTPESDKDVGGVFVDTSLSNQVFNRTTTQRTWSSGTVDGKNTSSDVDVSMFSISRFIELLHKGSINTVEMLFCPLNQTYFKTPIWDEFVNNRGSLISKRTIKSSFGFINAMMMPHTSQHVDELEKIADSVANGVSETMTSVFSSTQKIENIINYLPEIEGISSFEKSSDKDLMFYRVIDKKFPINMPIHSLLESLEIMINRRAKRLRSPEKNNVDWKGLSHGMRQLYQLYDLLTEGKMFFPVNMDRRKFLLSIKRGEAAVQNVVDIMEDKKKEIEFFMKTQTIMQDEIDTTLLEDAVLETYFGHK